MGLEEKGEPAPSEGGRWTGLGTGGAAAPGGHWGGIHHLWAWAAGPDGVGGVHAAAWAGLLLIEEMESQPRAPDGPRRSAACSGLGRTDLMGPEVCGNQGALSGGAVGPVPLWVPGKMLPSGAHRPKGEQVGGIRSVAHCAGRSPLLWALQDGCGELGWGEVQGRGSECEEANPTPVTAGTSVGQRWPSGAPW